MTRIPPTQPVQPTTQLTDQLDFAQHSLEHIENEVNAGIRNVAQSTFKALTPKNQEKTLTQQFYDRSAKTCKILKLLSRSMEHEDDPKQLERIQTLTTKALNIAKNTQQCIESSRLSRASKIHLQQQLSVQSLSLASETEAKIKERQRILENQQKFTASSIKAFENFGRTLFPSTLKVNYQEIDKPHDEFLKIVKNFYTKNDRITESDITFLRTLLGNDGITQDNPQTFDCKQFIEHIITACETSIKSKTALLTKLEDEFNAVDDRDKEPQAKKFMTLYRQFLNNPFEPLVFLDYELSDSKLITFTKRHAEIVLTPDEETIKYKIEGLKRIREQNLAKKPQQGELLISGGGPGGLMAGLIAGVQGRPFTIVEFRTEEEATKRENILALGNDDASLYKLFKKLDSSGVHKQSDLILLDFLGVTDILYSEKQGTIHDNGKNMFTAPINSIQKAMITQLKALTKQEKVVKYGYKLATIEPAKSEAAEGEDAEGEAAEEQKKTATATVTLVSSDEAPDKPPITLHPTLVYIAEGGRSETAQKLGIGIVKHSKAAGMGFAFFQATSEKAFHRKFMQKFSNFVSHLRTIPSVCKTMFLTIVAKNKGVDVIEAYFTALGRAEILLHVPNTDYLYYTVNEQDKKVLEGHRQEIQRLKAEVRTWAPHVVADLNQFVSKTTIEGASKTAIAAFIEKFESPETMKDKQLDEFFQEFRAIAPLLTQKNPPFSAEIQGNLKESGKRLRSIEKKMNRLERAKGKFLQNRALKRRRRQNFISSIMEPGSSRTAAYQMTVLTESRVQRATRNYAESGDTQFILSGDSESTTDPVSGGGLRYALQKAAIASTAFFSDISQNPFMKSSFASENYKVNRAMREEGLEMRRSYVKGTERLERYLDIAEEHGFPEEYSQSILRLYNKFRNIKEMEATGAMVSTLDFSAEEYEQLELLRGLLYANYINSDKLLETARGQPTKSDVDDALLKTKVTLTSRELEVFGKAWKSAIEGTNAQLTPDEMDTLKSASAKLATERFELDAERHTKFYKAEAWFVYVSTLVNQMKHPLDAKQ